MIRQRFFVACGGLLLLVSGLSYAQASGAAPVTPVAPVTPAQAPVAGVLIEDVNPDSSDLDDSGDPDGASGGRVNGLAADPSDNQVFYAASEWGGLFKTIDGGLNWFRLGGHLPVASWDVAVDPGNTGTVYATSWFDGREDPLSGIEVSRDGGATWTRPPSATPPASFGCPTERADEPWGFGIDIRPDSPANVAVGTNCGVAVSTNSGNTWTFRDPTPLAGAPTDVWDVEIQPGGTGGTSILVTCGDDGAARSTDGGANWVSGIGLPAGRCSMDASPDEPNVLFVAASDQRAYESRDGGLTWNNLGTPPGDGQGRVPFVAVNDRSGAGFDLWYGDISLWRATCTTPATPLPTTARCPAANTWAGGFTRNGISPATGAHDDAGDIVFDTTPGATDACPRLFSSDGGVYRNVNTDNSSANCQTPDGTSSNWEQANRGIHALWLFGMDGGDVAGDPAEDLYMMLQDNGTWRTGNAGAAAPAKPAWNNRECCDGFDVVTDTDRVVYTNCCFGGNNILRVRDRDMTGGIANQTQPPGGLPAFRFSDPIDRFGTHQFVAANGSGVFFTDDISVSPAVWTQLGTGPTSACAIQASVPAATPNNPTFYVQAGVCNERNMGPSADQLFKYTGTAPGGTWDRVDDNPGLDGGIGIFAVDPNDPNRLYASNIRSDANGGPRMVFSTDGGATWQPDPDLDAMMTGNGVFEYLTEHGPPNFGHDSDVGNNPVRGYPQPTLVAFDPHDPNIIVAGGRDSGVFLSTDGGANWGLITDPFTPEVSGVPHLPRPWFAYFDHEPGSPVRVYIGTQGRGVWRITLPEADVRIDKSDEPDPVNAGETLIYNLQITNDGPETADNVVVQDTLPEQATFLTSAPDVCTEDPTDVLTCPLGNLASGESIDLAIEVMIDPDTVSEPPEGPKGITNTATVTSSGAVDPDLSNNNVSESTIVNDLADLQVTKVSDPDNETSAGETFTFTIFTDNLGPSDARAVHLEDQLLSSSSNFTMGDPQPSQGTCTSPTPEGSFSCDFGVLPAGDRATVTVEVTSQEGGVFEDEAVVSSDTPDPDTTNNRAVDSIAVEALANLGIDKSDSPDPVVAGTDLTYTVSVTNNGPSTAVNVVIEDVVPADVTIQSIEGGPTADSCNAGTPGNAFLPSTCTYGTVAPNQTVTMTIVVRVNHDVVGVIHNDAEVSSDTFDPDNSDNLVTEDTEVIAEADLAITKADTPDPVQAGRPLTYTITVTNAGPSTAKGVEVEDVLPREVDFASATITEGSGTCIMEEVPPPEPGDEPGERVVCQLGTIDPNEPQPVVISIEVVVKSETPGGTVITDTATVSSSTADPDEGNNSASEQTTVIGIADLSIALTSDADVYKPSSTIVYTVTVTDNGPSDAFDTVVTFFLPETRHAIYRFDTGGCTKDGNVLTCERGQIANGTSDSFNVHVTVKGRQDQVSSTATVEAFNHDPNTDNNSSTRVVLVRSV